MLSGTDIKEIIEEKYIKQIDSLTNISVKNKENILEEILLCYKSTTKGEMLLRFRRTMEMLIKSDLILATNSISNNKIIAVRKENFLQIIDDRYYGVLCLTNFLEIFKLETKDFKSISNNIINEPHIGLIINYILEHFTNTFTRFINRNLEYYYIYEFFYENGQDIKKILSYLNAYHFSREQNSQDLYNIKIEDIKEEIEPIIKKIKILMEKI